MNCQHGGRPTAWHYYAYQYYDGEGRNNGRIRKIVDNYVAAYTTEYQYDRYDRLTGAQAGTYSYDRGEPALDGDGARRRERLRGNFTGFTGFYKIDRITLGQVKER